MRKFLLLLCACMLIPGVSKAVNSYFRVQAGSYASSAYFSSYADRLVVPYSVLGTGSAAMAPTDSYTIGMWSRLFAKGSAAVGDSYSSGSLSTATNFTKNFTQGRVFAAFGSTSTIGYSGNWCMAVNATNDSQTSGTIIIHGDDAAANGAGVGFNNISVKDMPITSSTEWTYVAIVVDNTNLKVSIYYNDELAGEAALSAPMYYSGEDGYFQFGGVGMKCDFDEIQLFNAALTPAEVAKAMKNPGAMKSLRALYTFDTQVPATNSSFPNVCAAGESVNIFYQRYTKTGLPTNGVFSGGTNAEYKLNTSMYKTSDRDVKIPVSVDPNIENGTVVVKINGEAISGETDVTYGTEVTVETVPADGYQLVDATANTVAGQELLLSPTYTVIYPVEFSAYFANNFFALTVENPLNIGYAITHNGVEVENLSQLLPGTTYKLGITVPEDVNFRNVTLNGKNLVRETDGLYHFTMTEDATLAINAELKERYAVNFVQPENGTIRVLSNGQEVTSGAALLERSVISVAAIPAEGYAIASLTLNGSPIQSSTTYTMVREAEIAATFMAVTPVEHCAPAPVAGGNATTNRTDKDGRRYFTKVEVSDGNTLMTLTGDGVYPNGALGDAQSRPVYDATAVVPQFVAEPGQTITVTTTGLGSWMGTYVFFDADLNGLDTNDLVVRKDGGDNSITGNITFTLPAKLDGGLHRMRYIVKWLEPTDAASPCEYGESGKDDGDIVFDIDFVIKSDEYDNARTITVATENAAYGTVAITDPATDEKSISTKAHYVTVAATPAEGYSFLNWTDAAGNVISSSATYEYDGEAAIELTAHFGFTVVYAHTGSGSVVVNDADGNAFISGSVASVGKDLTFKFTPSPGYSVSAFTVNGVDHVADVVANEATVTVSDNLTIDVTFAEVVAHVSWVVRGNGTVTAGYICNDDFDGVEDPINSGDAINKALFTENGLTLFISPGKADNGADESVESATIQMGEDDAEDILAIVEEQNDGGPEGDGVASNGNLVYYYTISELPSSDLIFVFAFTNNGASSSIDDIFGDEEAGAPAEYYNVNGVRVNGDNLTPGIYVVKKGSKTAKVMVM